mgnify:CR=1 FL=1
MVISTILGSCVAVCLWDSERRVGGMNHILVPEGSGPGACAVGHGASAMETLINALMKRGTRRSDVVAKVFGGASIVAGLSDVGARNSAFVFDYLRVEGIRCTSQSVGGTLARHIRFCPESGRVRQRLVHDSMAPQDRLEVPVEANGLELL